MKFNLASRSFILAAILAPIAAHADFRCESPSSPAERTACELAKQDTPDALIHYVRRTQSLYGLYLPEYVSATDVRRWDATRLAAERSTQDLNNRVATSESR
jgi:hypothetical protein